MHGICGKSGVAVCVLAALVSGLARQAAGQEGAGMMLPNGVKAVWDMEKAYREKTPTRERICINGLWRWRTVAWSECVV
jgi:hypothetical protein